MKLTIPILRLSNVKICFCSPTVAMIVTIGFLNCPNIPTLCYNYECDDSYSKVIQILKFVCAPLLGC